MKGLEEVCFLQMREAFKQDTDPVMAVTVRRTLLLIQKEVRESRY